MSASARIPASLPVSMVSMATALLLEEVEGAPEYVDTSASSSSESQSSLTYVSSLSTDDSGSSLEPISEMVSEVSDSEAKESFLLYMALRGHPRRLSFTSCSSDSDAVPYVRPGNPASAPAPAPTPSPVCVPEEPPRAALPTVQPPCAHIKVQSWLTSNQDFWMPAEAEARIQRRRQHILSKSAVPVSLEPIVSRHMGTSCWGCGPSVEPSLSSVSLDSDPADDSQMALGTDAASFYREKHSEQPPCPKRRSLMARQLQRVRRSLRQAKTRLLGAL